MDTKESIIKSYSDINLMFVAFVIEKMRMSMDNSKYGPFLDSWPKSCNENPLFFSDDELEYLKGSPFLEVVLH